MNTQYFETIKCNNYEIFNLQYHINRIAQTVSLNLNLQEYIYPPSANLYKCKIIYDKNGIISIDYSKYTSKDIESFRLVYDNDIIYNKKKLNRDNIDKLYNQKNSCDEIIIIKNKLLTDTSIANIAILYNNQWITPKKPLLKGTTLKRYLNNGIIKQKDITIEMLKKSSKLALLNAMIDFKRVNSYIIKDTNDK